MNKTVSNMVVNAEGVEMEEQFVLTLSPPTELNLSRTRMDPEKDGGVWVVSGVQCARDLMMEPVEEGEKTEPLPADHPFWAPWDLPYLPGWEPAGKASK